MPKLGFYIITKQCEVPVCERTLKAFTKPYDGRYCGADGGFFAKGKSIVIPQSTVFKVGTLESRNAKHSRYSGCGEGGGYIEFNHVLNKHLKLHGSIFLREGWNHVFDVEADWLAKTDMRQKDLISLVRPLLV